MVQNSGGFAADTGVESGWLSGRLFYAAPIRWRLIWNIVVLDILECGISRRHILRAEEFAKQATSPNVR